MKLKSILLSLLAGFVVATQADASIMNVESLRATLKSQHAGWQAKNSWVNDLTPEQLQRVLGYKERTVSDDDFYLREVPNPKAGTDAIDWRNKDGQNWVSPILNQGNCGSCVAFATVATLETQMNISRQAPWLNSSYSTDALFACGGGGCDFGWQPNLAAKFLTTNGAVDEACAPNTTAATGVDVNCNSICSDSASRTQKIASFTAPTGAAADVKAALKKGPVVTTLDVYADFLSYSSGIYKHTTGDMEGGHAVSIVGFNDQDRYWIVRNSWGADWGENGFVRVSYDDISGIGSKTWSFDVGSANGVATIRSLHDRDYLAGNVVLDAISTYPSTSDMALQMTDSSGKRSTTACKNSSCPFSVDSTKMNDGRYEANLAVTAGSKSIQTEKKYFYVANSRPQNLKLDFEPVSGTDLSKPVSDRPVFNVTSTSSTVPLSQIVLIVKQGGNIVETRSSDVILPVMTMGWRTTVVPNGTYDVYLEGHIKTSNADYVVDSNHFSITVKN